MEDRLKEYLVVDVEEDVLNEVSIAEFFQLEETKALRSEESSSILVPENKKLKNYIAFLFYVFPTNRKLFYATLLKNDELLMDDQIYLVDKLQIERTAVESLET